MTDIVERLRARAAECKRTTAHDIPDHYLRVVAKITQEDGQLMTEAADEIEKLRARVEWHTHALHTCHSECDRPLCAVTRENQRLRTEVKTWQDHAKAAIWSDSEECKMLTADNERLREIVASAALEVKA